MINLTKDSIAGNFNNLLSINVTSAGIIDDFFLKDPNVIPQSSQKSLTVPEKPGTNARLWACIYLREDKVNEVVEKKAKKDNLSDEEKMELKNIRFIKFFLCFLNQAITRELNLYQAISFLWKKLNGMELGKKDGFWPFQKEKLCFCCRLSLLTRAQQKRLKIFLSYLGKKVVKSTLKNMSARKEALMILLLK